VTKRQPSEGDEEISEDDAESAEGQQDEAEERERPVDYEILMEDKNRRRGEPKEKKINYVAKKIQAWSYKKVLFVNFMTEDYIFTFEKLSNLARLLSTEVIIINFPKDAAFVDPKWIRNMEFGKGFKKNCLVIMIKEGDKEVLL
jgi:hypothetical protein